MSNNCLTTTFKSSFEGDKSSLRKAGQIKVKTMLYAISDVNDWAAQPIFQRVSGNTKYEIEGDGYFLSALPANPTAENMSDGTNSIGKTVTKSNTATMRRSNGVYYVIVNDIYNMQHVEFGCTQYSALDLLGLNMLKNLNLGNAKCVDYVPLNDIVENNKNTLEEFRCINGELAFDISALTKATLLRVVRVHNNINKSASGFGGTVNREIVGDIKVMADCPNLIQLDVYNTGVSGDFYELIQDYRNKGRVSGSIKSNYIALYDFIFSFNGHYFVKGSWSNNIIKWDATKAYVAIGVNDIPAPSGQTLQYIYCIGYTDEEIATNIASGGVWAGLNPDRVIKCD